jgi:hypothetical protein
MNTKLKTAAVALAAIWFLGGPAFSATSVGLNSASRAIEQFVITVVNAF